MAAPRLSVALGPSSGDAPTTPVVALTSQVTAKFTLFDGPDLTFSMPGQSVAAPVLSGLATDVWLYQLGVLRQRFRVLPIEQEWDEDGDDVVSLGCVGYKRLVLDRHIIGTAPTYNGVDQGALIWDLIELTQAKPGGDLGLTAGSIVTGVPRDRNEYADGDKYEKIIGALEAAINGPVWDVNADLSVDVRQPESFPLRDQPAVHGTNVRRLRRVPGSGFANVSGAVGSVEQTVPEWREDAGVTTDPRGRHEMFDATHGSATEQSRVVEYAEGNLADALHPPAAWTMTLEPARFFGGDSDYNVGEFVRVVVPPNLIDPVGAGTVDVVVQVTEVSITFDGDGNTEVTATGVEVEL